MRRMIIALVMTLCYTNANAQQIYDARVKENEILTPIPKKQPKINGAKIYGAKPGRKFIYRIPCQGKRPMHFEIENLPAGLLLDRYNGIISGIVPQSKGNYPMMLTAENDFGKDSRSFDLVVGYKIALTPPTGWNSWGGHMMYVTDSVIRKAADVFVEKGLADVGFQYLSIDDCWMKIKQSGFDAESKRQKEQHEGFDYDGFIGEVRDSNGYVIPNKNFPDMKSLTNYIHSFGLKAGIYSTPGPYTCQNFVGSLGYQKQDADQYAAWGFDLLKYDLCSGGSLLNFLKKQDPNYPQTDFWRPMATYLHEQDRDILFNLCQYGIDNPWKWAPSLGISTWRIGGDLNHHVDSYFKYALQISTKLRYFSKPGQWNDPDFMYINKLRDFSKMANPSKDISLNTNQRYQYVSLWSIICAPFFFSCDINDINEFTLRLLSNSEVMNINQDELGYVAKVLKNKNDEIVMVKELANGSKVLALFNTNKNEEKVIKVNLISMGFTNKTILYDVWREKEVGKFKDIFSSKISPDGVGLFIVR
ncbi:alpha-galactosidase [Pedobacter sp. SD-b]|uniref:Alpha-galactosidase n=1 Tax=Pedobacter segetis TaxID=2793069 RepID=A0ABS1BLC7_9SPHI|nr:glycoside hydrolase family 27 protein [Pedobacter segetis]MBK0383695.1 alpha-galactosidase [Pedobacter segetis]